MELLKNFKKTETITLEQIDKIYDLTKEILCDSKDFSVYIENEIFNINTIIQKTLKDNYLCGAGLGYPFYAKYSNGEFIKINEIDSFIKEKKEFIEKETLDNEWICPNCQEKNNLPDLKSICKNCASSNLKPRDVLKTLPDIDQLIILDHVDDQILKNIQTELASNGYKQSDISIRDAVNSTQYVLDSIKKHSETNIKIPIDLHILSKKDFVSSLESIRLNKMPIVKTQSLRSKWETYELPFGFDFIFSFKEIGFIDNDIKEEILKTRNYLKNNIGIDKIISNIKNNSPRSQRIFNSSSAEEILREKINNW